jgi:hypothetical protein
MATKRKIKCKDEMSAESSSFLNLVEKNVSTKWTRKLMLMVRYPTDGRLGCFNFEWREVLFILRVPHNQVMGFAKFSVCMFALHFTAMFFYSRVKIFALPSQQQNLKSFVSLLILFIVRGIHCLTIIDNPYFITFLCYSDPRIISSGHSSTITHKHMPEIYN